MTRIFLSKADVTNVEEEYVLAALRSGWVAPLGPDVDALEAEVAERVGVAGALALTSGTAALHLALVALGARPGKVIVVPSMTFVASANAVMYTGATPVFVDSQASDGNVDPRLLVDAVDTLIKEGQSIAAVMTVDLFGRCADYDEIENAMAIRGIPVLEDAAEAFGAGYGTRAAGSFGEAAVISFNGNKIMTTSGGGMLLSDNRRLIERCRYLSTQSRQPAPHYEHTEIGYNYRMSNILAALGRGQLSRLDSMIERRREIRNLYVAGLAGVPGIQVLASSGPRAYRGDNCWLTSILLDPNILAGSAESVIKSLEAQDIEARHLWKPMHLQPMFTNSRVFTNGESEMLFRRGLSLPSGSSLADAEVDRVVEAVRAAVGSDGEL